MREKILIVAKESGEHWAFGIRYDSLSREVMAGGPWKYRKVLEEILREGFKRGFEECRQVQRDFGRIRVYLRMSPAAWRRARRRIAKQYGFTVVRSFRRLCS